MESANYLKVQMVCYFLKHALVTVYRSFFLYFITTVSYSVVVLYFADEH